MKVIIEITEEEKNSIGEKAYPTAMQRWLELLEEFQNCLNSNVQTGGLPELQISTGVQVRGQPVPVKFIQVEDRRDGTVTKGTVIRFKKEVPDSERVLNWYGWEYIEKYVLDTGYVVSLFFGGTFDIDDVHD